MVSEALLLSWRNFSNLSTYVSVKNFELFERSEFSKFRKQVEKQIPKGAIKEGPLVTFSHESNASIVKQQKKILFEDDKIRTPDYLPLSCVAPTSSDVRIREYGSLRSHIVLLAMTKTTFISIDYGTRKSGLAYSVEGFCFAHKTVETKGLVEYLKKWITERNASKIIIGLPLNIDGTESAHSKKVRKFAKELEVVFPEQEIILHDERLTTAEAKMSDIDDIDAESARLILRDYLAR